MMLYTSEMRDVMIDLPMTEDERMENFQLSDLSVAAFRNDAPIHLLKHVKCWREAPQHEQGSRRQVQETLPRRAMTTPPGDPPSDAGLAMET